MDVKVPNDEDGRFDLHLGKLISWSFWGPHDWAANRPPCVIEAWPVDRQPTDAECAWFTKFIDAAESVSNRRQTANNLFLVACAANVAGVGFCVERYFEPQTIFDLLKPETDSWFWLAAIVMLTIGGQILSYIWWFLLSYYRDLANSKVSVVKAVETTFDFAIKPFSEQAKIVNVGKREVVSETDYRSLNLIEQALPNCFGMYCTTVFYIECIFVIHKHALFTDCQRIVIDLVLAGFLIIRYLGAIDV